MVHAHDNVLVGRLRDRDLLENDATRPGRNNRLRPHVARRPPFETATSLRPAARHRANSPP
jgi:hypothetical protein